MGSPVEALDDIDPHIRWTATRALAHIGDRRAVRPISALLQDPVPSVKLMAVQALDHVGGPEAVSALTNILADERDQTTVEFVCAYDPFTRRKRDELSHRYRTARPPLRAVVATHLDHVGDARACEVSPGR